MSEDFEKTQVIEIKDPEEPEQQVKKKKKRGLSKAGIWFFRILLAASVAAACYSGYRFWQDFNERRQGIGSYDELTSQVMSIDTADEQGSSKTRINLDFDELESINSDIVGWLVQDTSVINYPIVQNADNDWYLNHLFTGEWNHMGCVFILAETSPDFSDRNTPLFAHGRRDGSMFGSLEKYESQQYYDEHKEFLLITKDQTVYLLEPFAGSINDATVPFVQTVFGSDDEYISYLQHWFDTSTFLSDVVVYPQDKVVTMLTCSDDFENARYALFCKMTDVSDQYEVVSGS